MQTRLTSRRDLEADDNAVQVEAEAEGCVQAGGASAHMGAGVEALVETVQVAGASADMGVGVEVEEEELEERTSKEVKEEHLRLESPATRGPNLRPGRPESLAALPPTWPCNPKGRGGEAHAVFSLWLFDAAPFSGTSS